MTGQADERLEELQLLRKQLASLNPDQAAKYNRWIGNAQDSGLQLDVKDCLAIAKIIARALTPHWETPEIKEVLSRVATDQHERERRRLDEADRTRPTAQATADQSPHRIMPTTWTDSGGMAEQQISALHMLRARQMERGAAPSANNDQHELNRSRAPAANKEAERTASGPERVMEPKK